MQIVHTLPDKWDSTAGVYRGKDLTLIPFLLKQYRVSDSLLMLTLITDIINETSDITNEQISKRTNNGKHK